MLIAYPMSRSVSMSTTKKFAVGDLVTPDPAAVGVPTGALGRVYKVTKVNPKNLLCDAVDGGRGINFPADMLVAHDEASTVNGAVVRPFQPREFFVCGQIVTLKKAWKAWTTETPLVVMKDNGNKVNVTLLGGDEDRYLRVPPEGLQSRDAAWLAEALLDSATA